jgi:Zn-dependent metalloprotease
MHKGADSTGTASTLYRGKKNITTNYTGSKFELKENGRNINTFNSQFGKITQAKNYVDNDNKWTESKKTLDTVVINNISQNWWYNFLTDRNPDLFIKVIDGNNNVVYKTQVKSNTSPPVTFTINYDFKNPPYKFQVVDYDGLNSNDIGDTYSIKRKTGLTIYRSTKSNGYYVNSGRKPGIDVHWGMGKTYDYFLNRHNRKSFDNKGSAINSFVNPRSQTQNASFIGASSDLFVFGTGRNTIFKPLVSLDIVAHEFTHGVTEYTASLKYQNESGALNESFSDIFAVAVDFYTSPSSADWLIGEDVMLNKNSLRSMKQPRAQGAQNQQPNTYKDDPFWHTGSSDNGGVHTNSGVQNYWFYLLAKGGSGRNGKNNKYSVNGIGIQKAAKIAYRNLSVYLTQSSDYQSAYQNSLLAAQDLYGVNSKEYQSVRSAWYAVGIGSNPNSFCDGVTELNAPRDSFGDGSLQAEYENNSNCTWKVQPRGADSVQLSFTEFDTESFYDTVIVYDGPTKNSSRLLVWWGEKLPPTITSSAGALTVEFKSDGSVTDSGWEANYKSFGKPTCGGVDFLTSYSGSFKDGSGNKDYANNLSCGWYIAPPCANSVTLSFQQFDTESQVDGIVVYNGPNAQQDSVIAVYTGASIPPDVTSSTGEMLVFFVSDYSLSYDGFKASYSASGSPACTKGQTLTADYNQFSDGSGKNRKYCNNSECTWLIDPSDAKAVTLNFTRFSLEAPPVEASQPSDAVEVYDGSDTTAPLLGRFSGKNIPKSITAKSGQMYVRFYTDYQNTDTGWQAYYTTQTKTYCSGKQRLTKASGSLADGSKGDPYGNGSDCKWVIEPGNKDSIKLSFDQFSTEKSQDQVIVYDGPDTSASVIGTFSGSSLPPSVTSSGGSMLVRFVSDDRRRKSGWSANYCSYPLLEVSSDTAICEGQQVQLEGRIADQYQWTPNQSLSCNNCSNPVASPTSTTTYQVTGKSGNGCNVTKEVKVNVSQKPSADAGSDQSICEGEKVALNASVGGSYSWSPNSTLSCSECTNPVASPATTTTYQLTTTNQAGCSNKDEVTVNVKASPDPEAGQDRSICEGDTILLNATGGDSYTWRPVKGLSCANCQSPDASPGQTITYYVTAKKNNGCEAKDSLKVTVDRCTGIADRSATDKLKIYPNPTEAELQVEYQGSNTGPTRLQIVNTAGQQVIERKLSDTGGQLSQTLNLQSLSAGVYTLMVVTEDQVQERRIAVY